MFAPVRVEQVEVRAAAADHLHLPAAAPAAVGPAVVQARPAEAVQAAAEVAMPALAVTMRVRVAIIQVQEGAMPVQVDAVSPPALTTAAPAGDSPAMHPAPPVT